MPQAADTPQLAFGRSANNRTTGSWKNDYLDREKYAVQLERLIANTPGPYVIGMTSSWGSGKTFFLTAWRESLLERRRPCVYFNAWETDHAGDPLVALAAQISQQIKEQLGTEDALFDLVLKKASQIARKAPKALVGMLIGLINQKTGSEIPKDISQLLSDSFEVGTAAFLQTEKARSHFKLLINSLAQKAIKNRQRATPDHVNNSTNFPLLVIIDELDRCRPDYAITLLESIKHLFNETGIVFLISMDAEQILSVIEHTFGLRGATHETSINLRQNYLRKFIDIFWALPDPDARSFVLQNLLSRQPAIPLDWPEVRKEDFDPSLETIGTAAAPLLSPASYHATLASGAAGRQKSLRELLQILEKFFVISSCYQMSTRESFVIFDILLGCPDETKEQNMSKSIVDKEFTPQSIRINPGESWGIKLAVDHKDPFINMFGMIINNSIKQQYIKIDPYDKEIDSQIATTTLEIVCFYLEKVLTKFSGKELKESVTQKIAFIDKFHFGG